MSVFREDTNLNDHTVEKSGFLQRVVRWAVKCKVYAKRSMGYVNMLTAIGVYKVALDGTVLDAYTWYLAPVMVVFVILVGWFEDKIGAFRYEGKFKSDRDPRKDEIIDRLERIEDEIQ